MIIQKKKHSSVILIDDSSIDNFVNKKIIKRYEFSEEILEFTKTRNAIKYLLSLNNNPDSILPSIIFLDLDMPEIDGYEFLETFNLFSDRLKENIDIIILTSSVNPADVQLCKKYHTVLTFLHKPLMKNNLDQANELLLKKNSKLVMC
jgi:response regulator RpfG family c-di-GMP phosphodiesterase